MRARDTAIPDPVSTGEAPAHFTHRQILVVLSGLMLGMMLAALDQTIVSTALPTIVGELGGLDHLSWVVTAYLLTSTARRRCTARSPTSTGAARCSSSPSSFS